MTPRHRFMRPKSEIVPAVLRNALQSAFPGATHTGTRTNTSFFPLDSRRELKSTDWREIMKKSRYLRNASGVARALFEKPVKFVCPGGLTPSGATPDEYYNEASDEYFENWATGPVDVTATYNFYESQEMIATEMPCDGDFFALKVKGYSSRCQLQFLRAHQIGDPSYCRDLSGAKFVNGLLKNAVGRTIAVRVLQDQRGPGDNLYRDYSAEDVLHIFDPSRLTFGRGLPWIYSGANPALDVLDMRALDQVARKLNLMLAGVIHRTGGQGAGLGARLNPNDLAAMLAASNGDPAPLPSAAASAGANVTWEQILGGGAVPILGDGEEFESIDTDRSPMNWIQAAEFLIREMAAGYGVSYEFIWNMAALGGPTARMMLEDLNAFCDKFRRLLIGRYCQSVRSWVLANAIIHGELEEPKSGNWWDCVWSGPPKVTVDRGRDGALYARLLEKGLITLDEWWSLFGKDSRRMRRKRIKEIKEDLLLCQKEGVPYTLYCATAAGSSATVIPVTEIATPGSPGAVALARLLEHKDASVVESIREIFGSQLDTLVA